MAFIQSNAFLAEHPLDNKNEQKAFTLFAEKVNNCAEEVQETGQNFKLSSCFQNIDAFFVNIVSYLRPNRSLLSVYAETCREVFCCKCIRCEYFRNSKLVLPFISVSL